MIKHTDPTRLSWRKRAALELWRFHRAIETKQHELRYLFWECTLRCNFYCKHCGSDCLQDSLLPDMPLSDFLGVLDREIIHLQDPRKVLIVLTGGEPTLRLDLLECGRSFQERGFAWGMVTNGWTFEENLWNKWVGAGLRSLTVSFDGIEEVHDQFRSHKGAYKKALQALQWAATRPELTFDAMTTLTPQSLPQLPLIRDTLISSGIKRWRLDRVFPKGRALQHPELFLSNEQYAEMLCFIRQTRLKGSIRVDSGCDGFFGEWEGHIRHAPFFCRAGINVGSVLADGSISACPSLRADYIQGNIYQNSFRDIWDNKFQIMRDRRWAKTGECSDCKHWKFCNGNGLHLRDEKSGKLAYCHLQQLKLGLYPELRS